VQQTENSIGYVGLEYAAANDIPFASIGEGGGNFVEPSTDTAQAAISAISGEIPDDLKVTVSSLAPQGEGVYPITGLTWMLVRRDMEDLATCKAVAQTAWYVTHEGQELAPELNYVPIPDEIQTIDEAFIQEMEAEGEPCYTEGG
jgi:phosphate transport system substrate-binding protein